MRLDRVRDVSAPQAGAELEDAVQIQNALSRSYATELHFDAPPDRVFPLLCPVREYDWIDGWECRMVYAETGVAELGGQLGARQRRRE